jgi:hypothetical protein
MDILGETKAGGINNSENVKDVRFFVKAANPRVHIRCFRPLAAGPPKWQCLSMDGK